MRTAAVGSFLLVAAVTAAAAGTWEVTRANVIEPINAEFHRHLPTYLKNQDLEALQALYTTETGTGLGWDDGHAAHPGRRESTLTWEGPSRREPIRERWRRLLAMLPSIDRAELRIDRIAWRERDDAGWPARARLIVRGRCWDDSRCQLEQHVTWHIDELDGQWRITAEDVTRRTLVARRQPAFTVTTTRAGIDDEHRSDGSPPFRLFGGGPDNPVHAPAGSAVGDYDRDGCPDVFLAGDPDAALYRNRCDGTFREVTTEAGLPRPYPAAATGAVFFDYDNDGWPDLFVAAVRGGHRLFRNRQGRFTDVSAAAGIPAGRWGSTVAVADYDRDGWLDVYVAAMGDHEHEVPDPSYAATNGVPNLLLHNRGDGTFAEVAEAAGVASTGWDQAAAWADYDGDAWPDLSVANEFGDNVLYRTEGDGTFTARTDEAGVAAGGAGMGVAWADYDADGDLDLFVSNMHANSGWALFHPDFPAPIPWRYRLLGLFTAEVQRRSDMFMDQLTRGSTLFRNDGDGGFTDVSDEAGVRDAQWGWAAEFLDYDHDGALDLYAVNGFITGPLLDDV
jgi:hypothetical protein